MARAFSTARAMFTLADPTKPDSTLNRYLPNIKEAATDEQLLQVGQLFTLLRKNDELQSVTLTQTFVLTDAD